jgi:hypothetical protein
VAKLGFPQKMDIKRDFQDSKYAVVRRMAQGGSSEIWVRKVSRMSLQSDAFALGMMIGDILSGFAYWQSVKDSPSFSDYETPFPIPDLVDEAITSKFEGLIKKNPLERLSVSGFADSQIFKMMNTKKIATMGDQKIQTTLMDMNSHIRQVSNQVQDMAGKLSKMSKNLNNFLPAIQETLM